MATKNAPSKKLGKKAPGTKAPGREAPRKRAATVKAPAGKAAGKSMPPSGRDPRGGLTAAGRKFFAEAEGSHLRPGVKGTPNTPEKMKRKGSFLTRHYTNPRGPVVRDGEPTRQALQAAAWGEPVPTSVADEKKLAAKGRALLEQFHQARGDGNKPARKAAKTSPAKKSSAKKSPSKRP